MYQSEIKHQCDIKFIIQTDTCVKHYQTFDNFYQPFTNSILLLPHQSGIIQPKLGQYYQKYDHDGVSGLFEFYLSMVINWNHSDSFFLLQRNVNMCIYSKGNLLDTQYFKENNKELYTVFLKNCLI